MLKLLKVTLIPPRAKKSRDQRNSWSRTLKTLDQKRVANIAKCTHSTKQKDCTHSRLAKKVAISANYQAHRSHSPACSLNWSPHGRPLRTHQHCKSPDWNSEPWHGTSTLVTKPRWPINLKARKNWNRKDACQNLHCTCTDRMGSLHGVCPQEGRDSPILHLLPQT